MARSQKHNKSVFFPCFFCLMSIINVVNCLFLHASSKVTRFLAYASSPVRRLLMMLLLHKKTYWINVRKSSSTRFKLNGCLNIEIITRRGYRSPNCSLIAGPQVEGRPNNSLGRGEAGRLVYELIVPMCTRFFFLPATGGCEQSVFKIVKLMAQLANLLKKLMTISMTT